MMHKSSTIAATVLAAGLVAGSAFAGSVLEKGACMSMGNTDAACTCAEKAANEGFQKAVSPAVYTAVTSGNAQELGKLPKADQEGGLKALIAATTDAVKSCGVKLQGK